MSRQSKENITVDNIRIALRDSIFQVLFTATCFKIEEQLAKEQQANILVFNLITFGFHTGLFSVEEQQDWYDVLNDKKSLAEVSEKWMKGSNERTTSESP